MIYKNRLTTFAVSLFSKYPLIVILLFGQFYHQ